MFCRCSAIPFQNKIRSLTTEGIQSQWEAPVREENNTDESRATAPQVVDVEKGSTSVEPSVPTTVAQWQRQWHSVSISLRKAGMRCRLPTAFQNRIVSLIKRGSQSQWDSSGGSTSSCCPASLSSGKASSWARLAVVLSLLL